MITTRAESERREARILRRIVEVDRRFRGHVAIRKMKLSCGHVVELGPGLRPSVGKLFPCPYCN